MSEQIQCECGFIVTGNSVKHAEANLKIHKTSKIHKQQMKKKSELSGSHPRNKQKPNIQINKTGGLKNGRNTK